MSEDRDPFLQSLFAEAKEELDPESFTRNIMGQTHSRRVRLLVRGAAVTLVIVIAMILLPFNLQQVAMLITQGLATELISIGNGLAAWLLAPINNIASLLVLSVKAIRVALKKSRTASYAS